MGRLTRAVAASSAALLTLAAAGCGGQRRDTADEYQPALARYTSVAQLVTAASAAQRRERFVTVHLTALLAGSPPRTVVADGWVRFDEGGASIALTQHMQPLGARQGPDFTLLLLPDEAFLRPPPGILGASGGKPWLRVGHDLTSSALTQFNQIPRDLRATADPTSVLAELGTSTATVTSTEETLDGAPATRYEIAQDASVRTTSPEETAPAQNHGRSSSHATLWLDDRDRPLRFVLSRMAASGETASTTVTTSRYRDWGQPHEVAPPPAAEVAGN